MSAHLRNSILILLTILLLSACAAQPAAPTPTLVPTLAMPTSTVVETPAFPAVIDPLVEATPPYPVEVDEESLDSYPYPLDDGGAPPKVPARENRSLVTAQLVSQAADETNPDLVKLRVIITNVTEIAGEANMLAGLVNQESDLFVAKEALVELNSGDLFDAEVSLRGDENGTKLMILKFIRD